MGRCMKCGKETNNQFMCYEADATVIERGSSGVVKTTKYRYDNFLLHNDYLCWECISPLSTLAVFGVMIGVFALWALMGILLAGYSMPLPRSITVFLLQYVYRQSWFRPIFQLMSQLPVFLHFLISLPLGVISVYLFHSSKQSRKKDVSMNKFMPNAGLTRLLRILRKNAPTLPTLQGKKGIRCFSQQRDTTS